MKNNLQKVSKLFCRLEKAAYFWPIIQKARKMDFRKVKRLHEELQEEFWRLEKCLTEKYGCKMVVTWTSDGLCVMFEHANLTGVGLDVFEELVKDKNFDPFSVETVL